MLDTLWKSVLGEVELEVKPMIYTLYFSKTTLVRCDEELAVIKVLNPFAKANLETKHKDLIERLFQKNGHAPARIEFSIDTSATAKPKSREQSMERTAEPSLDREEMVIKMPKKAPVDGLNPKYTFENFIVGTNNDYAFSTAQAIAKSPGKHYNPYFIYGGSGLGKTHLIQAIGNEIKRTKPDLRIKYITFETFTNEFLDHVRLKKRGFEQRYRNIDVLIVDDIQFIAKKEQTQNEFFHTFNALHEANKQIIISSDRPPREIETLSDRLRSRFSMGITPDVQMPNLETRQAIIQTKAEMLGHTLDRETVEYIAENVRTNIRELEGALNKVIAYADIHGITPDIHLAQGLMTDIRSLRPTRVTPKQIVDKTARYYQVDVEDIKSKKRNKEIVLPRHVAMYLMRSELRLSFPQISTEVGRTDHTTAIHSVEKIEKEIKLNIQLREQIDAIREKL